MMVSVKVAQPLGTIGGGVGGFVAGLAGMQAGLGVALGIRVGVFAAVAVAERVVPGVSAAGELATALPRHPTKRMLRRRPTMMSRLLSGVVCFLRSCWVGSIVCSSMIFSPLMLLRGLGEDP